LRARVIQRTVNLDSPRLLHIVAPFRSTMCLTSTAHTRKRRWLL
jgi:hypothetical protein